jgi:competence protein ComEC
MTSFIPRIPLIRLLLPFIAGIIFAWSSSLDLPEIIFIPVVLIFIAALIFQKKIVRNSINRKSIDGILILPVLFFCGWGICTVNTANEKNNAEEKTNSFLVTLLNDPVVKERSVKLVVEEQSERSGGSWKAGREKMLVYLQRDASAENLKYGDKILVYGRAGEIPAPKNPGEFDYKEFLSRQHIHQQVYSKAEEWKLVSSGNGNFFKASALTLRRYFLGKLQSYGFSQPAYGVAAALLLGASDHLDPGTLQAYSASGTLHVLSVSGMHVALVYIVLLKLLAPLNRNKKMRWINILLQLLFLWFYAMLTGLCPSVLRSVTMLSVVIAGNAFNRKAHILNSLAASALLLLLFDPLLIFDIGFQLSYLAVAGIVTLQPKLEKLWEPKKDNFTGKILSHTWTLIAVTIVAQVFTFPLGLYYFNQFPSYFILSNLIVIPLSTIVMYAGLFLLIVSPFAILAKPVSVLFGFLVELLNACVTKIEHLPFAVLHSSGWQWDETSLLYAGIILMLIFLLYKRKIFLVYSMSIISVLLFFAACRERKQLAQEKIIVFDAGRSSAIGIISGDKAVLLADTGLVKEKGTIDYHIQPFLEASGINEPEIIPLYDSTDFRNEFLHLGKDHLCAFGKQIVLAGNETAFLPGDKIIWLRNTSAQPGKLIGDQHPELIIADGTLKKNMLGKWKSYCEKMDIRFYNIAENGALEIK